MVGARATGGVRECDPWQTTWALRLGSSGKHIFPRISEGSANGRRNLDFPPRLGAFLRFPATPAAFLCSAVIERNPKGQLPPFSRDSV